MEQSITTQVTYPLCSNNWLPRIIWISPSLHIENTNISWLTWKMFSCGSNMINMDLTPKIKTEGILISNWIQLFDTKATKTVQRDFQ